MKVLIIQVGNPVIKEELKSNLNYFLYPTLIEGKAYFDEKQIINNVQTREGLKDLGCEVAFYFHTKRKKLKDLINSSFAIRRLVRDEKPDITHIYWGGVSGFIAQLFCPGKTVVSLLGSDLFGSYHPNGKKIISSRIQTLFSRLTAIMSTRTIVMSARMKNYLWNRHSSRIVVLPEGVVLTKFSPGSKENARKHLGWDQEVFIVIFFYEGQAVKNATLAHQAFDTFQLNNPEAVFKIISGYNHDELVHVYRAADCMLITSYHEGSNNSVKEAMACNLPVISVECGDAEERLGPVKNSFITSYRAEEIVSCLEVIKENRLRSDGSNFIYEVSIPVCSAQVLDLYNEMERSK
jgi:glycosyltransferase involved in cell wall biosynthesis